MGETREREADKVGEICDGFAGVMMGIDRGVFYIGFTCILM